MQNNFRLSQTWHESCSLSLSLSIYIYIYNEFANFINFSKKICLFFNRGFRGRETFGRQATGLVVCKRILLSTRSDNEQKTLNPNPRTLSLPIPYIYKIKTIKTGEKNEKYN